MCRLFRPPGGAGGVQGFLMGIYRIMAVRTEGESGLEVYRTDRLDDAYAELLAIAEEASNWVGIEGGSTTPIKYVDLLDEKDALTIRIYITPGASLVPE